MKVLLCGVPNSANIGDRVIAESIKKIINQIDSEIEIIKFDICEGINIPDNIKSEIKLSSSSFLKKRIPRTLRNAKTMMLNKKKTNVTSELLKVIDDIDLIFIGGGHLLIDNYLMFPLAIKRIVETAKQKNKPVHLLLVGAKGPWSLLAKKHFTNILNYSSSIAVRDKDSYNYLLNFNPKLNTKLTSLSDPAVFVNELVKKPNESINRISKVGLGIMDPNEALRHSNVKWDRKECSQWWINLATELASKHIKVNIFTNGSATDNGFVDSYIKPFILESEYIKFLGYPSSYIELLNSINVQDGVIAQRLHACIPAIALKKVTYGIKWDVKLKSIFTDLNLEEFVIDSKINPSDLVCKILSYDNLSIQVDLEKMDSIESKRREILKYVSLILSK